MARTPVIVVLIAVLMMAACGDSSEPSTSSPTDRTDDAPATTYRPNPDVQARDRLTDDQFETTVACPNGKQGIYPKVTGTLTNKSRYATSFDVWVAWYRGAQAVDLGVHYTKAIEPSTTGDWDGFTNHEDADRCEVVCVDRQHPTDPHKRERCQPFADLAEDVRQ